MTAESVPPHMLDGRAPTGRWTEVLAAFRDIHGPPILVGACLAAVMSRRDRGPAEPRSR